MEPQDENTRSGEMFEQIELLDGINGVVSISTAGGCGVRWRTRQTLRCLRDVGFWEGGRPHRGKAFSRPSFGPVGVLGTAEEHSRDGGNVTGRMEDAAFFTNEPGRVGSEIGFRLYLAKVSTNWFATSA